MSFRILFLYLFIFFFSTPAILNAAPPGSLGSSSHLAFIENKGQVHDQFDQPRPDILFSGENKGLAFYLRNNGLSYQLSVPGTRDSTFYDGSKRNDKSFAIYRVDISWIGINKNVQVTTDKSLAGADNYYLASCPQGVLDVHSYEGVVYKNIYNGIDLHFYGKDGALKYDYIVKPGADPTQIAFEIKGSEKISLRPDGSLFIQTPFGNIEEAAPEVYQNGQRIKASWKLVNNLVGFSIGKYNPTQPLLIDPAVRLWGTYYGGSLSERGSTGATDYNHNVILGGVSETSSGSMATTGAYQVTFGGGATDFFIAKFDHNGVRMWSTYFGGSSAEGYLDLSVDAQGNIFISGFTFSPNSVVFATPGAHQSTLIGVQNLVIAKFNASGQRIWSTYHVSDFPTDPTDCSVDGAGNVFICGSTAYTGTLLATPGAHQTVNGGGAHDAFLIKFSPSGVKLWGTFFGDSNNDISWSCTPDAAGNIYLAGATSSTAGIATMGSHQPIIGGPNNADGYLAKFSATGQRIWATYYGTAEGDVVQACATDLSGNVFITGMVDAPKSPAPTYSSPAIASPGCHQTNWGGGYSPEAFLAKFNSSGVRQWGTYYGAGGNETGYSVCTDLSGNVYMAGYSTVVGIPGTAIATANGHQPVHGGSFSDAFLAMFDPNGVRQWGTYYGSVFDQFPYACMTDDIGGVYLIGDTWGGTGTAIATPGNHQPGFAGAVDAFVAKFLECFVPTLPVAVSASQQTVCSGGSAILTATSTGYINWYASPTSTTIIAAGPNYSTLLGPGTHTFYAESATCAGTVSPARTPVTVSVSVSALPQVSLTANPPFLCENDSTVLSAAGALSYTWSAGTFTNTTKVAPPANTVYSVTGISAGGCVSLPATVIVSVFARPQLTVSAPASICAGKSATLIATGASTLFWNTVQGGTLNSVNPSVTTTYSVVGINSSGCLSAQHLITLTVNPLPPVSISGQTFLCLGDSSLLIASGAQSYLWSNNLTSASVYVKPSNNQSYSVTGTDQNGCKQTHMITVGVYPLPTISVTVSDSVICEGESAILHYSGNAISISWSDGQTDTVVSVQPSVNTVYKITASSYEGCVSESSMAIAIEPCTDLDDKDLMHLSVFPNPTSGVFFLFVTETFELSVNNSLGQLILSQIVLPGRHPITLEGFTKGVYQLHAVSRDGKRFTTKLLLD